MGAPRASREHRSDGSRHRTRTSELGPGTRRPGARAPGGEGSGTAGRRADEAGTAGRRADEAGTAGRRADEAKPAEARRKHGRGTEKVLTTAAFEYHAPATIEEAVALLAAHGESGRILAGGQSLVPAMMARLARPSHVIDINRVPRAERPSVSGGVLSIPPLMRHVDFEAGVAQGPLGRLLARMAGATGPLPVRLRGTFCGALANADPASEWCLAATVLGADIVVRSHARGARVVPAPSFFRTVMTTAAADDEMVVEVRVPLLHDTERADFQRIARVAGNFALATALVVFDSEDGAMRAVRLGVGAVEPVPRRIPEAERVLEGNRPDARLLDAAADAAARALAPVAPPDGDADFARDLARAAVRRALKRAAAP